MSITPLKSRQRQARLALGCLVVALAAPLTVGVAVAGLKAGVWDIEAAYDLLTMKAALALSGAGVIAALIAIVPGLSNPRGAGLAALAAVLVSTATAAVFATALTPRPAASAGDVSTDAVEPPGFSSALLAEREAAGADPVAPAAGADGCAVAALNTQVAPGVAAYGLQRAGFTPRGAGVGRADGTYASVWFDRTYDVAVRIRPDRTDVRVTARDLKRDRGLACALAKRIVAAMAG